MATDSPRPNRGLSTTQDSKSTKESTAHIYGIRQRQNLAGKEISASSTLNFTTQLSSLISGRKKEPQDSNGRRKRAVGQDALFATHNRGVAKRAKVDEVHHQESAFARKLDDLKKGSSKKIDAASWDRIQRNLQGKAKLYDELERTETERHARGEKGDPDWVHLADDQLIDFRSRLERKATELVGTSDDDDDGEEIVEYEDEFGRTRRGTRADAQWATRDRIQTTESAPDPDSRLVYGNFIQHQSFNPSAETAARMAELAERADRTPSPVHMQHYDATAQARQHGQGFYQFSADNAARQAEMSDLQREQRETERERAEANDRKSRRKAKIDQGRRLIQQKHDEYHSQRSEAAVET